MTERSTARPFYDGAGQIEDQDPLAADVLLSLSSLPLGAGNRAKLRQFLLRAEGTIGARLSDLSREARVVQKLYAADSDYDPHGVLGDAARGELAKGVEDLVGAPAVALAGQIKPEWGAAAVEAREFIEETAQSVTGEIRGRALNEFNILRGGHEAELKLIDARRGGKAAPTAADNTECEEPPAPADDLTDSGPGETGQELVEEAGADGGHGRKVIWNRWAVARDGENWHLFHAIGTPRRWRNSGRIDVTKGSASALALALVEGNGTVTLRVVTEKMDPGPSGRGKSNFKRQVIEPAVKKLRRDIRESVSRALKVPVKQLSNPIAWKDGGYISAVEFGMCRKDDCGSLVFPADPDAI